MDRGLTKPPLAHGGYIPRSLNVYYQRIWMIMNVTLCGFFFDSTSIEEQRRNLLHRAYYLCRLSVSACAFTPSSHSLELPASYLAERIPCCLHLLSLRSRWNGTFFLIPHPTPTLIKITKLKTQKGWVCFIWFYEQYNLFKQVFNTLILLEPSLTAFFFLMLQRYEAVRMW